MAYRIAQEVAQKGQLSAKQTQRLMMSSEMQQALQLLQLPVMELSQRLEEEMELNPVFELREEAQTSDDEEDEEEEATTSDEEEEVVGPEKREELEFQENDFTILAEIDQEFNDLVLDPSRAPRTQEDSKRQNFFESNIIDEPTLFESLMAQAQETLASPEELKIAEILAGSIDARGFLLTPLAEIALQFSYKLADLERVLNTLQTFEPPGVAARSLQEALLLQLQRQGRVESLAYKIVEQNFDDLIHNHIPQMQKSLGATANEVTQALEVIAKLDNHPGLSYSKNTAPAITPDVKVEEVDGSLQIIVNSEGLPTLRLNRKYLKLLQSEGVAPETKKFIEEKIQAAKWLMKTVQQRESTLERIVKILVQKNREFFLSPEGKMKPLTMKVLSEELLVHESTIARAVQNKYLYCPRGMMALRTFFNSTFVAQDGEALSSHSVKNILKNLIANEDKNHPYSDETLAKIIQGKGIPCARRTVAKFRAALGLGNQHQRRKFL